MRRTVDDIQGAATCSVVIDGLHYADRVGVEPNPCSDRCGCIPAHRPDFRGQSPATAHYISGDTTMPTVLTFAAALCFVQAILIRENRKP